PVIERRLDLDVSGDAVGREVAGVRSAIDEAETIGRQLVDYVVITTWAVGDGTSDGIVVRDDLLRIIAESVNVERNRIVEDAHAAANHCAAGVGGTPCKTGAGCGTPGAGDGLGFDPQTEVDTETVGDVPVILSVKGGFSI